MTNLTSSVSIPASIIYHLEKAMNHALRLGDGVCSVEPVSVAVYGECLTVKISTPNVNTVKLSQILKVAVMMLNDSGDIGYWFNDLEVLDYAANWEAQNIVAKLIY